MLSSDGSAIPMMWILGTGEVAVGSVGPATASKLAIPIHTIRTTDSLTTSPAHKMSANSCLILARCRRVQRRPRLVSPHNLHRQPEPEREGSSDTIATESSGTRGRSIWVHSSQVGLLDNSEPHNSLPERVGRWDGRDALPTARNPPTPSGLSRTAGTDDAMSPAAVPSTEPPAPCHRICGPCLLGVSAAGWRYSTAPRSLQAWR